MSNQRVLVICLDAFDAAIARKMMANGKLQGLKRVIEKSAQFDLEHGPNNTARYTGLTMEHFSSGMKPETAEKWSVVSFDPETYVTTQSHATLKPFFADLDAKVVVLDQPYFDMEGHDNIQGVVGWSGHDTGVNTYSYPAGLIDEINTKFPIPPSHDALNTMVYPSVEQTEKMADKLITAAKNRAKVAEWMFSERFTDWDVAVLGYGETHDAIEVFVHSYIEDHHVAHLPSAEPARRGLEGVYEAVSDAIETLSNKFPDAKLVVFTMHGMGKSDTDLMDMILLPEFMYRYNFGKEHFKAREDWKNTMSPALKEGEVWEHTIIAQLVPEPGEKLRSLAPRAKAKAGRILAKLAGTYEEEQPQDRLADEGYTPHSKPGASREAPIDWMPAAHYAPYWPKMKAFSVPTYFAAPIRVNLKGREAHGTVELSEYKALLDDIEAEIRQTRDIKTGDPVVKWLWRPSEDDPMNLPGTQGDIMIIWEGSPIGFRHPKFGDIGPAPSRRMGGHSGGYGAMWVMTPELAPGDYGLRSSFDVAPTVVDLMGQVRPNYMDGESVLHTTPNLEPAE